MIINYPHLCTKMVIFAPKYSSKHSDGEWTVLLAKYKVHHATPVILIDFKAKHLKGQRYAIHRNVAERCPITTNGKIDVYEVPFDLLEPYETAKEVREVAESIWN